MRWICNGESTTFKKINISFFNIFYILYFSLKASILITLVFLPDELVIVKRNVVEGIITKRNRLETGLTKKTPNYQSIFRNLRTKIQIIQ